MKSKIKKYAKFLMILLGVLAASEISANIAIYNSLNIERKEYLSYYNNNPKLNSISWLQRFTPHPYFGYEDQRIRNFEKAEFDKTKEFVIGILGASVGAAAGCADVASWTAADESGAAVDEAAAADALGCVAAGSTL